MAPSMLFLETQPGVVTARPDLVDEAAIKAWTAVYNGNSGNHAALTWDFINHYAPYLYIQPKPAEVPPFTAAKHKCGVGPVDRRRLALLGGPCGTEARRPIKWH